MVDSLKFLFWNIHNNPQNVELIAKYAVSLGVDVICLCDMKDVTVSDCYGYTELKHIDINNDFAVFVGNGTTAFYTRERKRYCLFRIESGYNINVALVHLNSDLHSSGREHREADIGALKRDLLIEEEKYEGKNTLVVGDFNDNPFSETLTGWNGFNTVYFKSSVEKGYRKLHEQQQDIFYNPMLHVLRDSDDEHIAKGTCFFKNRYDWDFYDQVLMKFPLVDKFDLEKLRIVSSFNDGNLVQQHRMNPKISDHAPIYFEILKRSINHG